uniref:Uncharacterized protein n=1 Tax=Cyprinus carpio TaxID=7962 RepID=A0A8C2E2M6_CYPCA
MVYISAFYSAYKVGYFYEHGLDFQLKSVIVLYRLSDCGVTDEGCAALASALRSNPSHLRELNLTGNKLGAFCLHNMCVCTVYIYVYINTNTCML